MSLRPSNGYDTGFSSQNVGADRIGGSGVVGYGNTTLMLSYKTGDYGVTPGAASGLSASSDVDFAQFEARLRYLLEDVNFLGRKPYFLAGFQRIDASARSTAAAGSAFALSGANTLATDTTIHAISVEGGQIWPPHERNPTSWDKRDGGRPPREQEDETDFHSPRQPFCRNL